jgi:DNA-binding protein Fis
MHKQGGLINMLTLKLILDSLHLPYSISHQLLELPIAKFVPVTEIARQGIIVVSSAANSMKSEYFIHIEDGDISQPLEDTLFSSQRSNELCEILQECLNDYSIWFNKLLVNIDNNKSVLNVISVINEKINNPIVIFDASFKLLGYSSFFKYKDDPDWSLSISKGYVTLSGKRNTTLSGIVVENQTSHTGRLYQFPEFEHRFFSKSLFYNNQVVGTFSLIEQEEEISDFSIDLIESIFSVIEVITYLVQTNKFSSFRTFEYLLKDLIINPEISYEEMVQRLRFERYELRPPFAVLCLPIKELNKYHAPLSFHLNQNINFIHANYHVFLIENYSGPLQDNIVREVNLFLNQVKIIAGLSTIFEDITEFSNKFQESIKTLYFNRNSKESKIYHYKDDLLRDFFETVSTINNIDKFLYKPILELKKTNSTLYETLVAYVNHLNNQNETSLYLGIHRTTLDYRLKKIHEDFKIDFNNAETVLQIFITSRLLFSIRLN